jgi:hypothetical protein
MTSYPMNYPALSLAQRVRLWFILGVEALSMILIIALIAGLNYSPTLGVTVANGDAVGVVGWVLISQVAVITLAVITFIRFLHPKESQPPMYHGTPPTGGQS